MTEKGDNPQNDNKRPKRPKLPPLRLPVFLLIVLGVSLLFSSFRPVGESRKVEMGVNEFHRLVESGDVERLTMAGNMLSGETASGQWFTLRYPPDAMDSAFIGGLREHIPSAVITVEAPSLWGQLLVMMLPWFLILGVIWFIFLRRAQGGGLMGGFSKSKHEVIAADEGVDVTFKDVAGVDEAKEEVQEIVEFLKAPRTFGRLGGRIPRGVLLVGQPGCGKTLLAKAIAGEAKVPFLSVTGSDFVEMFVGVGASRVRSLFQDARQSAPCIVFIDEIDAVGRKRGASFVGGGHDEREQTLNAILVEMDGFKSDDGVIVLAATNRADILDPALVRPGRFDREVHVPAPDMEGREQILRVHAAHVRLGPDIDMRRVARGTPMFSGADLEALVNEAALIATMRRKDWIEQEDMEEARDKVRWGKARKSHVATEDERRLTAYHEAGHAVIQSLSEVADPVHKVSIIPRGPYGGATFSLPEKDRVYFTRAYANAMMRVAVGGRVAEEAFLDDISSGASSDIRQATALARQMVEEWGMDEEMGFVHYGPRDGGLQWNPATSQETAREIEERVKRMIGEAMKEVAEIVREHRDGCERVASALLEYETITGEEVQVLLQGGTMNRPDVPGCGRSVPLDAKDQGGNDAGTRASR